MMDDTYWDSMDNLYNEGFKAEFCYMTQQVYDEISKSPRAIRFMREHKLQLRVNDYITPDIIFTNDVLGGTRRKI